MSRGGWGGSSTIELTILRWRNTLTGEILVDEPCLDEDDETLEQVHEQPLWEEVEFSCSVSGSGGFTPGRYSGPPEDCYPDEEDFEIADFSSDCPGLIRFEDLTKGEQEDAAEKICDSIKTSGDDRDYDDYGGYDDYG